MNTIPPGDSCVLNPPELTAADLIPVEILCKRAGTGVRNFYMLVAGGKAPAPVRGVPRQAALAWLRARGITIEPPAGELIRLPTLCELAGITVTHYCTAVYQKRAPRQLRGVPKGPATTWLRAWTSVVAAKEKLRAVSQPSTAEGSP